MKMAEPEETFADAEGTMDELEAEAQPVTAVTEPTNDEQDERKRDPRQWDPEYMKEENMPLVNEVCLFCLQICRFYLTSKGSSFAGSEGYCWSVHLRASAQSKIALGVRFVLVLEAARISYMLCEV